MRPDAIVLLFVREICQKKSGSKESAERPVRSGIGALCVRNSAAAAAVSVVVVAAAAAAAEHEENQEEDDNPPEAVAIVTAHNQTLLISQ